MRKNNSTIKLVLGLAIILLITFSTSVDSQFFAFENQDSHNLSNTNDDSEYSQVLVEIENDSEFEFFDLVLESEDIEGLEIDATSKISRLDSLDPGQTHTFPVYYKTIEGSNNNSWIIVAVALILLLVLLLLGLRNNKKSNDTKSLALILAILIPLVSILNASVVSTLEDSEETTIENIEFEFNIDDKEYFYKGKLSYKKEREDDLEYTSSSVLETEESTTVETTAEGTTTEEITSVEVDETTVETTVETSGTNSESTTTETSTTQVVTTTVASTTTQTTRTTARRTTSRVTSTTSSTRRTSATTAVTTPAPTATTTTVPPTMTTTTTNMPTTTTTTTVTTTTVPPTTSTTTTVPSTTTTTTTSSPPESPYSRDAINRIFRETNARRLAEGVHALELDNSLLSQAASIRAREISSQFAHKRPDGREFYTITDDLGITYNYLGENIARGTVRAYTPEEIVQGWIDSPSHRETLMSSNYSKIAIGYFEDANYSYYVQIFWR